MNPEYEKCPFWDGKTMSPVLSVREYRLIRLVTTEGTITAFVDKTNGVLTLNPEAYEASMKEN